MKNRLRRPFFHVKIETDGAKRFALGGECGAMAATIKDIREKTGLSLATISKYLNGGNVLPENRRKIERAIDELHYEVNELARGLATSRTQTVGVMVYSVESLFCGRMLRFIGEALRRRGYGLLICDSNDSAQVEAENVQFLLGKRVAGIIVIPIAEDAGFLAPAARAGIPAVLLDRPLPGDAYDCVRINNFAAARRAVELLLAKGHRKIAVISSDERTYTGWERRRGYLAALAAAGLTPPGAYVKTGTHSIEFGHNSMRELLGLGDPPTAVLTTNYEVTLGAVMAVNECGVSCPDQISMLGFDDLILAHIVRPRMHMVVQPMQKMGERAVELLLERIQNPDSPPVEIVLGTALQAGNSIREI